MGAEGAAAKKKIKKKKKKRTHTSPGEDVCATVKPAQNVEHGVSVKEESVEDVEAWEVEAVRRKKKLKRERCDAMESRNAPPPALDTPPKRQRPKTIDPSRLDELRSRVAGVAAVANAIKAAGDLCRSGVITRDELDFISRAAMSNL